ncbi:MAG TPA: GNAT family N-acetyltransferase [Actinomycetales bacterium]|nr:GNAT family N-acetyltransferase [Actinomycetales bacterium]
MTTVRTLVTRPLTTADLRALESLHGAAKCDAPIGMEKFSDGDDAKFLGLAQRVLQTEGCQTFGAFYEEELVGAGVARHVTAQQDGEKSTVHIEVLYVRPEFRRRGIGQLLLKEIADWAALMRATHVACLPLPAARRARRYLAMMGFLPGVAHRVIPTALLRRRLSRTRRGRLFGSVFQNHAS